MPPGARLVVIEGEQAKNVPHPRFSTIDLQMLVVAEGGRERSGDEIARLLVDSGLGPCSQTHTATDLVLVEATAHS
jgi:hypothetical protein